MALLPYAATLLPYAVPLPSVMTVVRVVLVAELALVVLTVLALFTVTAVRAHHERRRSAIESSWHCSLRRQFDSGGTTEPTAGLEQLSARRRITAITSLIGSLSGATVMAVTGRSALSALLMHGDAWTHSRLWWRRLHGVRTLAQLDEPPSNYRTLLTDPRPAVRAEVADWVARSPDDQDIARLVTMLSSDVGRCQFAAENALRQIGAAAVPALMQYLSGPAPRAAVAMEIAAAAGGSALIPAGQAWSSDLDPANRAASAALMAAVGSEEAGPVLLRLVKDVDPTVRAAAATGLGTIALWSAAPQLTQALHDPNWSVRRAAAAALRVLGPVGRLCLRRALDDDDDHAADIARHVLDLPTSALDLAAG